MFETSKKQKLDDMEFVCTFDQTNGLRTMIEVVGNILTRINLRLIKDEATGRFFLCIDSIDPQHVCMIQARLNCEKVTDLHETVDFCIDSNLLNLCLKGIPTHYSLDIMKRRDTADIHIRAYETLSNSHQMFFKIPTIVDDSETMQLNDMSYKYTIEIDLGTLRQIVKMSTSLRASEIALSVKEPKNDSQPISRTAFTIGASGDAQQEHTFFSATMQEDDEHNKVIRAATDASSPEGRENEELVTTYTDAFSSSYLNLFLKSMERQIITMKLSKDKPLILHYELGADKSYICFVLAPRQEESQ